MTSCGCGANVDIERSHILWQSTQSIKITTAGERFTSEKEFATLATKWPMSRLVAIWNSFAGVAPFSDLKPVKKFETRNLAIGRICKAATRLDKATAPNSAALKPAKATSKAAKPAPAPRPGAVFEREYKGKSYSLRVADEDGGLVYRIGSKKYDSLTAAAKDVTGYASISGPAFWGKGARAATA